MYKKKINPFVSLVTCLLSVLCIGLSCNQDKIEQLEVSTRVKVNEQWVTSIGDPKMSTSPYFDSLRLQPRALSKIIALAILNAKDSTEIIPALYQYLNDTNRVRLRDTAQLAFEKMDWQKSLSKPFSRYHLSFGLRPIPTIFTLITDFNYGLFLFQDDMGHDAIGIGKEMFMASYPVYDQLSLANPNFSSYINRTFNINHLPAKIMYAFANDVVKGPTSNRVLDHILTEGKKLYFLKAWMPEESDTILYEYTAPQWTWVKDNELDIWRFLLADRLLYKTSGRDIANLTQSAPHSQGMPPEAPGRAANYIGYRIILEYMKKTKLSHPELAELQDYDRILKEAKYRPR